MAIDRIADPSMAASAYLRNSTLGNSAVPGADDKGVSFADFMQEKVQDAITTMKTGETMSAKAVTGEANLTAVIQAVTEAEMTLNTVVAVRDRMISAYQDIMRMPI